MATTPKPAAKPAPAQRYASKLIDPTTSPIDQLTINIHGAPGSGKTIAALTASQDWPEKVPTTKPVLLSDVIHVAWDHGALSGAQALGVRCAAEYNANAILSSGKARDVLQAMAMIMGEIGERCASDDSLRVVVIDTVTSFDLALRSIFFPLEDTARGEINTQAAFGKVLTAHRAHAQALVRLPPHVIVICLFHSRVLGGENDARMPQEQKQRQKLVKLSDAVSIVPSVTGQAQDLYLANASLELACIPSEPPRGSKAPPERRLWTVPYQSGAAVGLRTKNRFQACLGEWEPAHLGKLLAKIRAASAK